MTGPRSEPRTVTELSSEQRAFQTVLTLVPDCINSEHAPIILYRAMGFSLRETADATGYHIQTVKNVSAKHRDAIQQMSGFREEIICRVSEMTVWILCSKGLAYAQQLHIAKKDIKPRQISELAHAADRFASLLRHYRPKQAERLQGPDMGGANYLSDARSAVAHLRQVQTEEHTTSSGGEGE